MDVSSPANAALVCAGCGAYHFHNGTIAPEMESNESGSPTGVAPSKPSARLKTHPVCPLCHIDAAPWEFAYNSGIVLDRCGQCHSIYATADKARAVFDRIRDSRVMRDRIDADFKKPPVEVEEPFTLFDIARMVVLFVLGVVVCYYFIGDLIIGTRSASWPQAGGAITSAAAVHRSSGSGRRYRSWYEVNVAYEYSVDGVAYEGTGTYADESDFKYNTSEAAEAQAKFARSLESVAVYYDPQNPSASALVAGRSKGWTDYLRFILLLFVAVLLPIGLVLESIREFVVMLRRRKAARNAQTAA